MKIQALQVLLLAAAVSLGPSSTASADVQLTLQNGRVSIVARDATIRQILTEWARVGQTKIVNVERIPGGPVSIELNNVTESQALEILLRALSGYIAAPRAVEVANLSRFDRIIVMPTLASARPAVASTPPPVYQQPAPQFVQQAPQPDDDDDEEQPTGVPPQNRGPVFNTFPQQPQLVNPQGGQQPAMPQVPNQPAGSAAPSAPFGGVAVPGMVAPPPQPQPGQPQPMPPPRRPGGR